MFWWNTPVNCRRMRSKGGETHDLHVMVAIAEIAGLKSPGSRGCYGELQRARLLRRRSWSSEPSPLWSSSSSTVKRGVQLLREGAHRNRSDIIIALGVAVDGIPAGRLGLTAGSAGDGGGLIRYLVDIENWSNGATARRTGASATACSPSASAFPAAVGTTTGGGRGGYGGRGCAMN